MTKSLKKKILIVFFCSILFSNGYILKGSQDADKIANALADRLSGALNFDDTNDTTERELMLDIKKMMDSIIFDAVNLNPKKLAIKKIYNRYKLVEGRRHYILDFGSDKKAARLTWLLFRVYGIQRICFVGRPHAAFQFALSGGETRINSRKSFYKVLIPGTAPTGDYLSQTSAYRRNLKILKFQNSKLKLMELPSEKFWKYKILSGGKTLLKFHNKEKAIASFVFIKLYKFNQMCTIYGGGKLKRPLFRFMRKVIKTLKEAH